MKQDPKALSKMKELALKWQDGTISQDEKILFNYWYDSQDNTSIEDPQNKARKEGIYDQISQKLEFNKRPSWLNPYRYFVAAAILLLVSFIMLFKPSNPTKISKTYASRIAEKIVPGNNKAVLTLADGSSLILDNSSSGKLAEQGAVLVTKAADGKINYEIQQKHHMATSTMLYNTITTPKGGQYQVNLADGTKVWLNAASSLKFPTTFDKNQRIVELIGEAYFEVNPKNNPGQKNSAQPFLVKTNNQVVEVLGTHFNVNAYQDESETKTTLLEGSVQVSQSSSGNSEKLRPGQQSIVNNTITVLNVDATQSIEWQKGYFSFDNENVESIMRKISRWYDVDVQFRGNIRFRKFGGRISKFEDITEVLRVMEKTQVIHFKIEGRKIIVMP